MARSTGSMLKWPLYICAFILMISAVIIVFQDEPNNIAAYAQLLSSMVAIITLILLQKSLEQNDRVIRVASESLNTERLAHDLSRLVHSVKFYISVLDLRLENICVLISANEKMDTIPVSNSFSTEHGSALSFQVTQKLDVFFELIRQQLASDDTISASALSVMIEEYIRIYGHLISLPQFHLSTDGAINAYVLSTYHRFIADGFKQSIVTQVSPVG